MHRKRVPHMQTCDDINGSDDGADADVGESMYCEEDSGGLLDGCTVISGFEQIFCTR